MNTSQYVELVKMLGVNPGSPVHVGQAITVFERETRKELNCLSDEELQKLYADCGEGEDFLSAVKAMQDAILLNGERRFNGEYRNDAVSGAEVNRAGYVAPGNANGKGKHMAKNETKAENGAEEKAPKPAKEKVVLTVDQKAPSRKALLTAKLTLHGENYRREGTKGHQSIAILAENPGITGAEFEAAGGRLADIQWDMKHKELREKAKIEIELAPEPEKKEKAESEA